MADETTMVLAELAARENWDRVNQHLRPPGLPRALAGDPEESLVLREQEKEAWLFSFEGRSPSCPPRGQDTQPVRPIYTVIS
jgi:hypothetical protein